MAKEEIKREEVLHLFINKECGHNCPLCCNRLYKIDEIPVVTVQLLKSVQTVCLTGGDPMYIKPEILADFIVKLRTQYQNIENLYIYTSGTYAGNNFKNLIQLVLSAPSPWLTKAIQINGLNVAPKDIYDWIGFVKLLHEIPWFFSETRSNRLYVFKEQRPAFDAFNIEFKDFTHINIIDRQWTKVFNTPSNEHFARLPILF